MPRENEEADGFSEASDKQFKLDDFLTSNKVPLALFLIGLSLLGAGVLVYRSDALESGDAIEVITATEPSAAAGREITIEIAGEVIKPGVYKLQEGARIEDALIASGGYSADADREWSQKYINRASKLTDGQKLYVPSQSELAPHQDYQSSVRGANNLSGYPLGEGQVKTDQNVLGAGNTGLVNINNASLGQLDTLPGIGQVYGQKIIEQRPYSNIEELLSKGVLKKNVYEKIKDLISVY